MEVSYSTMIAAGNLVKRLAQNARRLEKALAETMNTSAEWKRIADELKAERNAEREQHTAIKQALGVQDAKEAGKALGMVEGEGLRAAAQRVVKERAALRAECDDLRRVFALVHISLGIQQGEHIGNAIDALKKERDELATRLRQRIARGDFAEMRLATLAAELETERERHRQTAAVPQSVDGPRTHPVKVGEWVKRTKFAHSEGTKINTIAQVVGRDPDGDYLVSVAGSEHCWCPSNCTPCDPPEATHDTPAGKKVAESAAKTEPVADEIKVGDLVEVVSNRGRNTWLADVGSLGTVTSVDEINDSISVHLDDVPGKKNALARYVSFCDVRKVTT